MAHSNKHPILRLPKKYTPCIIITFTPNSNKSALSTCMNSMSGFSSVSIKACPASKPISISKISKSLSSATNSNSIKISRKISVIFLFILFIWDYLCWFLSYAEAVLSKTPLLPRQGGMIETLNIKALLWKKSLKIDLGLLIHTSKQGNKYNLMLILL